MMHLHHDTTTVSGHCVHYVTSPNDTDGLVTSPITSGGTSMLNRLLALLNRDEGATMVEYGLMVALIAIVALIAVTALGGSVRDIFQSVADTLTP